MVRAAVLLIGAAVACATMSCVLLPAEYEADAGPNPPPYVIWDTAFPAFLPTLAFNDADQTVFTVTVGDADVDEQLKVRFCAQKTPQGASYLISEKLVEPTSDHMPNRKPVSTDYFYPCTIFASGELPPETTRYLYVVVTDGTFLTGVGCDVAPGTNKAMAAWSFTCDKPK